MAVYGVIGQRRADWSNGAPYGQSDADFDDYDYIEHTLGAHFSNMEKLISGGGRGVEHLAGKWAKKCGVNLQVIKPALTVFTNNMPESMPATGRATNNAFIVRNVEIISGIDRLIVFWNGSEPLIMASVIAAIKLGKQVIVYPMHR